MPEAINVSLEGTPQGWIVETEHGKSDPLPADQAVEAVQAYLRAKLDV